MADAPPPAFRWSLRDRLRTSPFEKSRAVELRYVSTLRKVGKAIGDIIDGFPDPVNDPAASPLIQEALARYSEILGPWAEAVGARMVAEVDRQDASAWNQITRTMSRALRAELANAPTGAAMRESLARQVELIKSLPTDAAERVHALVQEAQFNGTRAKEIAKEIARSGEVSASRAMLIARTEVTRASTELTKARAQHIGSTGYIWRTSKDSDVRPSHRKMEGRFVEWNNPPTLDGMTGNAGCLPNCRCWTEVVVPDA